MKLKCVNLETLSLENRKRSKTAHHRTDDDDTQGPAKGAGVTKSSLHPSCSVFGQLFTRMWAGADKGSVSCRTTVLKYWSSGCDSVHGSGKDSGMEVLGNTKLLGCQKSDSMNLKSMHRTCRLLVLGVR